MLIDGYKVTSNHATRQYPANCRVKSPSGVLLARVEAQRGDVLAYLRSRPQSEERSYFVAQLLANDVPQSIINKILAVPADKENVSVVHRIKERK